MPLYAEVHLSVIKADARQNFQAAIKSLAKCTQPVIAAMFGLTLGIAIDITSACDIRLAASNTTFAIAVRTPKISSLYT
jgi:enoyl-CoA hydratase/carnithine racemase